MAVPPSFLRIGLHRLTHEIGQPGKFGVALQGERERLFVGKHVLAERGGERRDALDDLGEALLGGTVEAGAGAAEADVIALEHALLLGAEPKGVGLLCERIDAAEQGRIGLDLVPMAGELRGDPAFQLEQGLVAVGADQHVEDVLDPGQRPSASLHGRDRIVEAGGRGVGGDGCNLSLVLGESPFVCEPEILRFDAVKRRDPVGCRPGGEEGVLGHVGPGHRRVLANGEASVIYVIEPAAPTSLRLSHRVGARRV